VINYETLKKLAKISLKGTEREFNVLYKDPKRGLSLNIMKKKNPKSNKKTCVNNLSQIYLKVEEKSLMLTANDVSGLNIDICEQ